MKAFIAGCEGTRLTPDERAFFADTKPFALIVFRRNCRDRSELFDLTSEFRELTGGIAPVLVDQEGGRVMRLRPPTWPAYPAMRTIGAVAERDLSQGLRAAWLHGRLIATDLRSVGIDMNCAPVLDVATAEVSDAIGDRAFGSDPAIVAQLGRALAGGLSAGGVVPVMKHIPGHGRATSDSHKELPVVSAALEELLVSDFAPFADMADMPAAMTAHILYTALDPHRAATVSPYIIQEIIREKLGFDGLLLSDDVSMNALSGDYADRAAAIYDAGCDVVLHCNGRTEEMRRIGDAAPVLGGKSQERAARVMRARADPAPFERDAAREEFRAILASVGWPEANVS